MLLWGMAILLHDAEHYVIPNGLLHIIYMLATDALNHIHTL